MKHGHLLGIALAFGLLSSPAAAQSDNGRVDRDRAVAHHEMDRHHDMRMHDRMRGDRMDRWCHSRRHMSSWRCRSMMHRHHHRMHHHM